MYGLDVQEHLTQGNEGKFRIIVQQCPLLIKYLDNKRLLGSSALAWMTQRNERRRSWRAPIVNPSVTNSSRASSRARLDVLHSSDKGA